MNECIFCLEGSDDDRPILHNVKCRCNFCFHMTCYELYDKKATCPICRATVGELYNSDDSYYQNPLIVVEVPQVPHQVQQIQVQQPRPIRTNYFQRFLLICIMIILLLFIVYILYNIIQYKK